MNTSNQDNAPGATKPANVDNIDNAGKLLLAYSDNFRISLSSDANGDGTVLLASMLYAIAGELRRIADAMEARND